MTTPTSVLMLLWQEGFFEEERTYSEIVLAIKTKRCTFKAESLTSALRRAQYLTPVVSANISKYTQRTPPTQTGEVPLVNKNNQENIFINEHRLQELRAIKAKNLDFTRLLKMCEELNDNFSRHNYISTIYLIRAIIDHVPPIFCLKNFSEVANQSQKSIKESLLHLENSSRKIADTYLHIPIRRKEILPNITQVDFSQSLDVLLGEIVRFFR